MTSEQIKTIYKENKRIIITLAAVLVILLGCWLTLVLSCKMKSDSLHSYSYDLNNLEKEQDGLSLKMDVSKSWEDNTYHLQTPHGAQYDFKVKNTSSFTLKDYSVDVTLSEKVVFDGGWNGTFETDNNMVKFTSEVPLNIVPGDDEKPFGAILYTEEMPELEGFVIKGYWDANIKDSKWYWALLELSFFYLVAAIFAVFSISSKYAYTRKSQKDAEIIEQSMKILTGFIDAKDAYTKDHSARVAKYSREIGKRLGLDRENITNLYYISLMHDCGKISIPDEILKKKGALSSDEFAIIKTHTTKGSELLKKFSALPGIGDGAHYHHERYDGFGYPSGLKGENIPLFARIICVADAYDAMSSNRCYRDALSKDKILSELTSNSGKQFDPQLVPIIIDMINDGFVDEIRAEYNL